MSKDDGLPTYAEIEDVQRRHRERAVKIEAALKELCDFIGRADEHELVRARRYQAYIDARAALLPI